MREHNYYKDYINGEITLTAGYSKVIAILNELYEIPERTSREIIEHYQMQSSLFSERIAHNFMLSNDYEYINGNYIRTLPAKNY